MTSRSGREPRKTQLAPRVTDPPRDAPRSDDTVTIGTSNCKFSEAKGLLRFAKRKIDISRSSVNNFSRVFAKKIEGLVPWSIQDRARLSPAGTKAHNLVFLRGIMLRSPASTAGGKDSRRPGWFFSEWVWPNGRYKAGQAMCKSINEAGNWQQNDEP